jgi:uncharacterized membrane protein
VNRHGPNEGVVSLTPRVTTHHEVSGSSQIVEAPSERSFGFTFSVVFVFLGLRPLLFGGEPWWWSLGVAALFLIVTLVRPSVLEAPNRWWHKFGLLLFRVLSPIFLALIYSLLIVPLGLLRKALRKDSLTRKFEKAAPTYWIDVDVSSASRAVDFKRQF